LSVWESHVTWGTPVQSFVFLGLLVFELEPMYATSDRRTDDGRRWLLNAPAPLRGGGIIICEEKDQTGSISCDWSSFIFAYFSLNLPTIVAKWNTDDYVHLPCQQSHNSNGQNDYTNPHYLHRQTDLFQTDSCNQWFHAEVQALGKHLGGAYLHQHISHPL